MLSCSDCLVQRGHAVSCLRRTAHRVALGSIGASYQTLTLVENDALFANCGCAVMAGSAKNVGRRGHGSPFAGDQLLGARDLKVGQRGPG